MDGGDSLKKLICLSCLFIVPFLIMSCTWDPYSGQRPIDYGDAKWVCTDPSIYFTVDTSLEDASYHFGEIDINGQLFPCRVDFIHQTNQAWIDVFESQSLTLDSRIGEIHGACDFSEDSIVVHIDLENTTVFNGRYESITFYRHEE